jgi:2-oxoglutarate dehydrogenase E2 component (dihydrolipoamide succinyltransferase)
MAIDIKVPAAGESITSANIAKWYKSNGDSVKKGEPLVSLETDKVSNELEAEADGILTITVGEGEEVSIGTVIGKLETSGAQPAAAPAPAPAAPISAAPSAPPAASGEPVEIKVPAAGESITSANIAAWRKNDGEHVEKGEILVSLETDKVSNDLEAPVSGTLHILVPEGEEVTIGKVIAKITPGGAAPAPAGAAPGGGG